MMTTLQDILQSRIIVVGLGKSGLSVCRFLHARSCEFEVVDSRSTPPNLDELLTLCPDVVISQSFEEDLFARFDTLIVSPGVALSTPSIKRAIENGALAIGDIELFALSVMQPIIAVTGSNGKSSVVSWIDRILSDAGIHSVLCGNIGEPVLDSISDDAEVYVVELSSFQLETTYNLRPLSATVLNVSEDHMDRYTSLEHYAGVKRRVFQGAINLVVNSSDPLALYREDEQVANAGAERVFRFGQIPSDNEFSIERCADDSWLVTPMGKILPISELPLPGLHNVMNALAVIALVYPLLESDRLTMVQLREGLKAFQGLPHRTEMIRERRGVRWYNDSKGTNVEAARRAIEAMSVPVVLIAGGLGKGADFTSLRAVFKAHVKTVILIGRDAGQIAKIAEGVADVHFANSMQQAVEVAASLSSSGDAVLLSPACSSFDMFNNFEHRGEVFSDEVRRLAA